MDTTYTDREPCIQNTRNDRYGITYELNWKKVEKALTPSELTILNVLIGRMQEYDMKNR